MECRLRLIERIQSFEKIQSQMSETKSVKSCKSRRSENVASSIGVSAFNATRGSC